MDDYVIKKKKTVEFLCILQENTRCLAFVWLISQFLGASAFAVYCLWVTEEQNMYGKKKSS